MNSPSNNIELCGSYVALPTPFKDNKLDEQSLRLMLDYQLNRGTNGVVIAGTTGEASSLSSGEYIRAIEIGAQEINGSIPLIAGAGANDPKKSVTLMNLAKKAGANAALCVAGYYNCPSQAGLIEHFSYIHTHSELPILLYNIPKRTRVDLNPETVKKISDFARVIGIKDATDNLSKPLLERHLIKKQFNFLSGDDMTALAYNVSGGNGCISVSANIVPDLCAQIQSKTRTGDYDSALKLHDSLVPLHAALFREPNPVLVKYGLSLLGLCTDEVRLPMVKAQEDNKRALKEILLGLNLL